MRQNPFDSRRSNQSPVDRRAAEREARLAAALRTNLRRRKAQSRARQDAAKEGSGDDPPSTDANDRDGT